MFSSSSSSSSSADDEKKVIAARLFKEYVTELFEEFANPKLLAKAGADQASRITYTDNLYYRIFNDGDRDKALEAAKFDVSIKDVIYQIQKICLEGHLPGFQYIIEGNLGGINLMVKKLKLALDLAQSLCTHIEIQYPKAVNAIHQREVGALANQLGKNKL